MWPPGVFLARIMNRCCAFTTSPLSGVAFRSPFRTNLRSCGLTLSYRSIRRCTVRSSGESAEEAPSKPLDHSNEEQKEHFLSPLLNKAAIPYTSSTVPISKLPPMLQHYVRTKRGRPGFLLLYRVGDFYETFFEDAVAFSEAADLALTTKPAGRFLDRVPMAGVPHYSLDDKLKQLLGHGLKVAVCDQVGTVEKGGLMERRVTRIITPGTLNGDGLIEGERNNFLACVRWIEGRAGLSVVDVTTGELELSWVDNLESLLSALNLYNPAEILVSDATEDTVIREIEKVVRVVTLRSEQDFQSVNASPKVSHRFGNMKLEDILQESCGALLSFVEETMEIEGQVHLSRPIVIRAEEKLRLDDGAVRNLELVSTIREGKRRGSLIWAVDRSITAMGSRALHRLLLGPLTSVSQISKRHDAVEFFCIHHDIRRSLRHALKGFSDLERVSGRLYQRRCPRDLRSLAESLLRLPSLISALSGTHKALPEFLEYLQHSLSDSRLFALATEVDNVLTEPAPVVIGPIGAEVTYRVFVEGYDAVLDELCRSKTTEVIRELEERERTRTKIASLKIRRVRNSGYAIMIPRSVGSKLLDSDPSCFANLGYDRTLSTKFEMRFKSAELNKCEDQAELASSRIVRRELELFDELRDKASCLVTFIRSAGRAVAMLDVLAGFAELAVQRSYIRPQMLPSNAHVLHVVQGRHPVVEQTVEISKGFIPNDVTLSGNSTFDDSPNDTTKGPQMPDFLVLTGPNASGKSCYLRMSGLLTILAQAGSFVPAKSATISVIDRIFTRVGASDDVGKGLSTFQVEMNETAAILDGATGNSLILLDEVGRGTAYIDGVSIAWAVAEELRQKRGSHAPMTIFATHYHELNELAKVYDNVACCSIKVVNMEDDSVIVTHEVVRGGSWESHGVEILKRSGFPEHTVERASRISKVLKHPARELGLQLRRAAENGSDMQHDASRGQSREVSNYDETPQAFHHGFLKGYTQAKSDLEATLSKGMEKLIARIRESNHTTPPGA